jgi:hypothetical protein
MWVPYGPRAERRKWVCSYLRLPGYLKSSVVRPIRLSERMTLATPIRDKSVEAVQIEQWPRRI